MSHIEHAHPLSRSGIVTVAFLKAQLDAGSDHLGIFLPLVLDVVDEIDQVSFTAIDIQDQLVKKHGLAMPQEAVGTLLGRAQKKKLLLRTEGRYRRNTVGRHKITDISGAKAAIEQAQERLGRAFREHAVKRGLAVDSDALALQMLFRFLQAEQVGLLLGAQPVIAQSADTSSRERAVVAEFIQFVIRDDPAMSAILRDILQGLVLYQAAFLPDLGSQTRKFQDLLVAFDSVLVRQALGYEGTAARILLRDTMDMLLAGNVRCVVFDKTVQEIHRILAVYEARIGTAAGRRDLRPNAMARHFLTQQYSRADVREMSALLETEIKGARFAVQMTPEREAEFTASELALAHRLAKPDAKDELEPRVQHDVDCVAAVLQIRGRHQTNRIEDARAVFATSSPLVIVNTRHWYFEDERGTSVEPIVHIRALANLAWLKKPSLCSSFKERELVALCAAALRPSQETWQRFLKHLHSLEMSKRLTSDEVTAIVVSKMSDQLLREAEEGSQDVDAVTLDEVVDRVKASYVEKNEEVLRAIEKKHQGELRGQMESGNQQLDKERKAHQRALAESEDREKAALVGYETARRRELVIAGRANTWSRWISRLPYGIASVLVVGGALSLMLGHRFGGGWVGGLVGAAITLFVLLELMGVLKHLKQMRSSLEACLNRRFRRWLMLVEPGAIGTENNNVGQGSQMP